MAPAMCGRMLAMQGLLLPAQQEEAAALLELCLRVSSAASERSGAWAAAACSFPSACAPAAQAAAWRHALLAPCASGTGAALLALAQSEGPGVAGRVRPLALERLAC
jgi:hypothetical protein